MQQCVYLTLFYLNSVINSYISAGFKSSTTSTWFYLGFKKTVIAISSLVAMCE